MKARFAAAARSAIAWCRGITTLAVVAAAWLVPAAWIRGEIVEYNDRQSWEAAVKHFTTVPKSLEKLEKDKPLDVGLVTLLPTGTGNVQMDASEAGTLKLSGSGTTRPWFRHTVTVNGGGVSAIGFDFHNGGHDGMYKSTLMHDGITTEKIWPGPSKGFLGYVDTKGRGITGFSFGSTGRCNFTGASVENVCLSNLMPLPGIDSVPPAWAAFTLQPADDWDAMLAANPPEQWQRELSAAGSLPPELRDFIAANSDAVRFIGGLRKIALVRAMLERFPEQAARHPEAHQTLSRTTREIVVPWWPDSVASPFGTLHEYPKHFELATRWDSLVGGSPLGKPKQALHPKDVQGLLNVPPQKGVFLMASPSHAISYHTAIDRILLSLPSEQLAPLRDDQDRAVGYLVEKLLREQDADAAVRLARRAPWARCVHEMLLEFGESALREGRRQWALACFGDVLRHAVDPELVAQARTGRWLALAQDDDDRGLLAASLAGVPADAALPWRGGSATVEAVRKQLLPADAGPAITSATLPRTLVRLPPTWPVERRCADGPLTDLGLRAAWPASQVQAVGAKLFVFAPTRVGRFTLPDGSGPAWLAETATPLPSPAPPATPPPPPGQPPAAPPTDNDEARMAGTVRRPVAARGGRSSAVSDDGRLTYTYVSLGQPHVLAIDAASGVAVWSTGTREDWSKLVPMSRPAAADGRVYLLAVPAGLPPLAGLGAAREAGPVVDWRLVCADGRDGSVIWEQILGWQPYTVLDLARGSLGVSLEDGSISCCNDMGIVARCDVRDGAVDWVRGYASMANTNPRSDAFGREGTPPILAGDVLLVAPRDHSGVLAFDIGSGGIRWEAIAVPSDRLVGVVAGVVIGVNNRRLCGLDLASGRPLWSREFAEGTAAQAVIVGDAVFVMSGRTLHRLRAANGESLDTLPLGGAGDTTPVLLGNRLVELAIPK